jgi:hypothetical protein
VDIAIHHRIGRGTLNLTRTEPAPAPSEPVLPALPSAPPSNSSKPGATAGHEESEGEIHGESERRGGGFASIMHGALCVTGFLLVLPSGVLVVQYAKLTGDPGAFRLHQLLQFGLGSCPSLQSLHLTHLPRTVHDSAGGLITGGTLAYRFMDDDGSDVAMAHEVIPVMMHLVSPY